MLIMMVLSMNPNPIIGTAARSAWSLSCRVDGGSIVRGEMYVFVVEKRRWVEARAEAEEAEPAWTARGGVLAASAAVEDEPPPPMPPTPVVQLLLLLLLLLLLVANPRRGPTASGSTGGGGPWGHAGGAGRRASRVTAGRMDRFMVRWGGGRGAPPRAALLCSRRLKRIEELTC